MENIQLTIIDISKILFKSRRLIIITFIVVCFITAGISLTLPKWYLAHSTILPPMTESAGLALSSLIQTLPLSGLGLSSASEESDLFIAIIKSRTVMEAVVRKFDLVTLYEAKSIEQAIRELRSHVAADIDDEGTITVNVEAGTSFFSSKEEEDKAKELARDMANFFIEELDRVNRRLKSEKARNLRVLIEKRYNQNIEDLTQAEQELKDFQQKYGIIALPEQATATITAAAELKAQIIAKEIESGVLSKYVGTSHADYLKVQNELKELERKYHEFKYGTGSGFVGSDDESSDLFLTLENVPELGMQYARLYREVMLQEKLLEFLLPQYEDAKIQEAKDTATVQVLDEAVKPEKKSRPRRAIIVIFYGFLSLIFSSMFVFFKPAVISFYKNIREKNE